MSKELVMMTKQKDKMCASIFPYKSCSPSDNGCNPRCGQFVDFVIADRLGGIAENNWTGQLKKKKQKNNEFKIKISSSVMNVGLIND